MRGRIEVEEFRLFRADDLSPEEMLLVGREKRRNVRRAIARFLPAAGEPGTEAQDGRAFPACAALLKLCGGELLVGYSGEEAGRGDYGRVLSKGREQARTGEMHEEGIGLLSRRARVEVAVI